MLLSSQAAGRCSPHHILGVVTAYFAFIYHCGVVSYTVLEHWLFVPGPEMPGDIGFEKPFKFL